VNATILNESISPQLVSSSVPVGQAGLAPPFIDSIPAVGPYISKGINFISGLGDNTLGINGNAKAEWFFVFVFIFIGFIIVKKVIFK